MPDRARLLGNLDPAGTLGVEIGALHAPTVTRAEGRVLYVDHLPTETLRRTLRHPGVHPDDVLPVDIVWPGPAPGGVSLAAAIGEPAGYVIARHVIEHVPDLIGWLQHIHAALRPGGILGLAIPDRRVTFDSCRNDSTIGEVVAAHLEQRRRPSPSQIIEAAAFSAAAGSGWRAEQGRGLPPATLAALPDLFRWLKHHPGIAEQTIDVHCWVFTPCSFLALAEALAVIGCFPFVIEAFYPTEPGAIEFQLRLRATSPADPAIPAAIAAARAATQTAPCHPDCVASA
jgi:SAM-dependent methyltransferase